MLLAIIWVMMALSVGVCAKRVYNRIPTGWILLAIFISPLLAMLILMIAGKKGKYLNEAY